MKTEYTLKPVKEEEVFCTDAFEGDEDTSAELYKQIDRVVLAAANKALSAVCVEIRNGIEIRVDGVDYDRLRIPFYDILEGQVVYHTEMMTEWYTDGDWKKEELESIDCSITFLESTIRVLRELQKKHTET